VLGALALGVGCGGSAGNAPCEGDDCATVPPGSCTVGGVVYADGAGVPSLDGCNSCGCNDGQVACTLIDCNVSQCNYQGNVYDDGEMFASADGCNSCMCSEGDVACTERACPPDPPSCTYRGQLLGSGQSISAGDGCNTCACIDGMMACTLIHCTVPCGGNAACGEAEYCAMPHGFCGIDYEQKDIDVPPADPAPSGMEAPVPPGECLSRPDACEEQYSPVCGCDGVTYGSPCAAATGGINVAYTGECQ
jgi:TILa domain/Kazal-type serine protease inhibitor domain